MKLPIFIILPMILILISSSVFAQSALQGSWSINESEDSVIANFTLEDTEGIKGTEEICKTVSVVSIPNKIESDAEQPTITVCGRVYEITTPTSIILPSSILVKYK